VIKTFVRALALSLFLLSGLKSSAQEVQTAAYTSSDRPTITIPSGKVIEIISGNFVFGISGSSQQIYGTPDPLPIYLQAPRLFSLLRGLGDGSPTDSKTTSPPPQQSPLA
jgi:hypothetical protein